MKEKAAHACRALCRARVAEELQRRRGTRIGEHLKMYSASSTGRSVESVAPCSLSWSSSYALSFASLAYVVSQTAPMAPCWRRAWLFA